MDAKVDSGSAIETCSIIGRIDSDWTLCNPRLIGKQFGGVSCGVDNGMFAGADSLLCGCSTSISEDGTVKN